MDGSRGGDDSSPAVEAAEKLILRWDSAASSASASGRDGRTLFDASGDRSNAEKYLRAVDEIRRSIKGPLAVGSPRRLSSSSSVAPSPENALQIAMVRLEDEFRNVLRTRANQIDVDSLVDLGSLSMKSAAETVDESADASEAELATGEEDAAAMGASSSGGSTSGSSMRRRSYESSRSIREIELLPENAVQDLRKIAERMADAGYGRECVQVYTAARKAAVELCFRQLGVEKLSIGDVQRLGWEVLEDKIRRWIRTVGACVKVIFASERRLCELVFEGISGVPGGAEDSPFVEAVKGAAIQLFGFAEAISIGRRSPEKLFKMLDLHDSISTLLPDIVTVFRSKSSESIYTQVIETSSRLAEAVRGILSEFENAVLRDPSKIPVPGGTIHPMTRYVMNYIGLMSDYKLTLEELIVTKPSGSLRLSGEGTAAAGAASPEFVLPESANQTPLASHFLWILVLLNHNLDSKANLYNDASLCHLFLMNNVHYIVHKGKDLSGLKELISHDYLKKLKYKYQQAATHYQRASWAKILHCLRDEGLHVRGSFSSGVSKPTLRERFKAFNAAFDEAHRTQSNWSVPDTQLREELRLSITEKLLPAYRSFLGRFQNHIESGRHPETYIKYSVDDLEMALNDFFEGCPPPQGRKKFH